MTHAWTGAALAAGAVVFAYVVYQLRTVADIGGAYKAKILCSALFGSRRTMDLQRADEIYADSYLILRPFRAVVDRDAESVTCSFAGWRPRTAVHRPGLGATLVYGDRPERASSAHAIKSAPSPHSWRTAATPSTVQRLVDRAFEEPDAKRLHRSHAVLVIHDGVIVAERYARGITPDTPLPGWSMAKSVLNTLVGVLIADGRLRLDQRELRPEWRAPDPRAAITLEDLLRMRSGLRFSENYANPWSDVLHMLFNCADAAGYAAGRPLDAAPGRVWQYSSGTTNILSEIVSRTVGRDTYADWPRRVLFDPLGMTSAVLEPDASGTFVCSSFMLATARDWARFGQLWLEGGSVGGRAIVPREWVDFSTLPTPQSADGRFGAHWWLKLNPEIGGDTADARAIPPDAFFAIGHEGQTLTVIPSKRLVLVRMGAAIYIDAWNHASFVAGLANAFT